MFHMRACKSHVTLLSSSMCLLALPMGCTQNSTFSASSAQSKKKPVPVTVQEKIVPAPENVSIPEADNSVPKPPPETRIHLEEEVRTTINKKEVWVVTSNKAHRIIIDEAAGYPKTSWSIPPNSGSRTYVSEIGLLIGRTVSGENYGIYRASDKVPGQAELLYKPKDAIAGSRICVVSFQAQGKSFVGAGYMVTAGGVAKKKFIRFPIDETKASGVDISKIEEAVLSASVGPTSMPLATYSCGIDQARGYAWFGGWDDLWGVNVRTLQELRHQDVPNPGATNDVFALSQTSDPSYALALDAGGNVLSAPGVYTFAHEPISDVIFASGGGNLQVMKGECFRKPGSVCKTADKYALVPAAQVAAVGPMSNLGDGRIAAIQRGATSQVFLLSLKDRNNIASGVEILKIADIEGDAYMYNDFTGGSLYAATWERTLDFSGSKSFDAEKPITNVKINWRSEAEGVDKWEGLTLSVRCYRSMSVDKKPEYQTITNVPVAGVEFKVEVPSCAGRVDRLDMRVEPAKESGRYSRVKSMDVVFVQGVTP